MAIEVTKEEAEEITARTRHKEIKESLKALAESLRKVNNKDVVDSIVKHTQKVEEFLLLAREIQHPVLNVDLNQDKTVSSIAQLGAILIQGQQEVLSELKKLNAPKEWVFNVKRDGYNGYIESVKATMVTLKSKFQA